MTSPFPERIVSCPHHNSRGPLRVQVIVLHADASPNETGTVSWLMHPTSKVSYHALIGRKGVIYRCVPPSRRAWHAGVARWEKQAEVNGISLGLAFSNKNDGVEPLTEAQIAAAKQVLAEWRSVFGNLPVTTHALVAPGRKTDPNAPNFRLDDYAVRLA
jgi:N-acetylmuramoyl-L-alanine amidase